MSNSIVRSQLTVTSTLLTKLSVLVPNRGVHRIRHFQQFEFYRILHRYSSIVHNFSTNTSSMSSSQSTSNVSLDTTSQSEPEYVNATNDSTATTISSESNSTSDKMATPKGKKRRLMLVVAYDGTKYHGSFSSSNNDVPTIDRELWNALRKINRIRVKSELYDSHVFPSHGLFVSRCSRTDKGVHAMRYMLSLEIAVEEKEISAGRQVSNVVQELNEVLPDDISVLSCTRVANKFQARKAAFSRSYEYYLPLCALVPDTKERVTSYLHNTQMPATVELSTNEQEAFNRFKEAFSKMVGIKTFHNFTSLKHRRDMCSYKGTQQPSAPSLTDHWSLFPNAYDDFISRPKSDFEDLQLWKRNPIGFRQIYAIDVTDPFFLTSAKDDVLKATKSFAENTTMSDESFLLTSMDSTHASSVPAVKVTLTGNSFVFNQIRHMIGVAIAYARQQLPIEYIDATLDLPRTPFLPLAPPGSLVLRDVDFDAKYFIVSELPKDQASDDMPVVAQEMRNHLLESGQDMSNAPLLALMHKDAIEREQTFFDSCLKPRLIAYLNRVLEFNEYEQHTKDREAFAQEIHQIHKKYSSPSSTHKLDQPTNQDHQKRSTKRQRKGEESDDEYDSNNDDTMAQYDMRSSLIDKDEKSNEIKELQTKFTDLFTSPMYYAWNDSFGGWLSVHDSVINCPQGLMEREMLLDRYKTWKTLVDQAITTQQTREITNRINTARRMFGDMNVWPEVQQRKLETFWSGVTPCEETAVNTATSSEETTINSSTSSEETTINSSTSSEETTINSATSNSHLKKDSTLTQSLKKKLSPDSLRPPIEDVGIWDVGGVLPKGIRTHLMATFHILSSRDSQSLMRAIGIRLLDGTWPVLATQDEYIDLIKQEGTENLLRDGMHALYLERAQEVAHSFTTKGKRKIKK